MDATNSLLWSNFKTLLPSARMVLLISLIMLPWLGWKSVAQGQVRTKRPDRGVYESPSLTAEEIEDSELTPVQADVSRKYPPPVQVAEKPPTRDRRVRRELVEVMLEEQSGGNVRQTSAETPLQTDRRRTDPPPLQPVGHQDIILVEPGTQSRHDRTETIAEHWIEPPVLLEHQGFDTHDATCDGCDSCGGCDTLSCDSMCCDGVDCGCGDWLKEALCFNTDRWFGGAELLLMWRKGDRLPPLVTTGPDTDPDTAGELGQPGTVILAGDGRVLKDLTAGGRFTLGYWLDHRQCQGLAGRIWFAGKESTSFGANQDQIPVLARPFLNVSDNQAAAQNTLLVAFPIRSTGAISVRGSSEVFGADISVRQFMYGKFGGTIDLVYGYQYMRLKESLAISSTSTSLVDDVPPLNSVISVNDQFDTSNDFHGGQLGIATRYRERCWSFNTLLKFGFGALRRTANRSGSTVTMVDGDTAFDPNGLLVRSTNSGKHTDNTFGWVPELDATLGYQFSRHLDATFGYHIIAMTDALQASGAIDPNLAVNLSDPPTGQQRPTSALRYDTFYVQGIHFGLQLVF